MPPPCSLLAAQGFVVIAAVPEGGLGVAEQVLGVKWTLTSHPPAPSVGAT
ncbi:hypothetical protein ACFYM3_21270 [Streptomyces massasporeus]|uniref:Uncharacterized protein n=1 Tax=Streptomyces massasporeus TaxID=67324 RepID=A0ABW6LHY0_9ACTN